MRAAIAFFIFGVVILVIGIVLAMENRPPAYESNMAEISR
jgi:hypothetical protein